MTYCIHCATTDHESSDCWTNSRAQPRPAATAACNKVPPGNGYCDQCAAGHYEKCRYVVAPSVAPEPGQMMVSLQDLGILAATAERNGTSRNFADVALQWAGRAQAEIQRLRAEIAAHPPLAPLTHEQIEGMIERNHFNKHYVKHMSDLVCLDWYRLGIRDAESEHGIVNE